MAFNIEFVTASEFNREIYENTVPAKITIGGFQEYLLVSTDYWDALDYKHHWKESLDRLLFSDSIKSTALITEMHDLNTANFIKWWPIYILDKKVFVQNQILFLDDINEPLDIDNIYSHLGNRESTTEEGDPISEWTCTFDDLTRFSKRLESSL